MDYLYIICIINYDIISYARILEGDHSNKSTKKVKFQDEHEGQEEIWIKTNNVLPYKDKLLNHHEAMMS